MFSSPSVREDCEVILQLQNELEAARVRVWTDRADIRPGERWRASIKNAIRRGAFFVACFSENYSFRPENYVNEELVVAIERLRLRPADSKWFIPVKLSPCDIPERPIGPGETLADLQYLDLHSDWQTGLQSLLAVIGPETR